MRIIPAPCTSNMETGIRSPIRDASGFQYPATGIMVLILAYGNSLRRDDGSGYVLADLVERMITEAGLEVERIDSHQLEPELALDISREKITSVLFIDTRALPETPNEDDLRVQFRRVVSAKIASPGIGHHLNPQVLLAYSRYLFNKEPPAWLITVPGTDFDHGEGLSETARKAIDSAPAILSELIPLLPVS
ncbi:MAG: hydrogenase maturation protease [Syntrophobacteraceae bacterium]